MKSGRKQSYCISCLRAIGHGALIIAMMSAVLAGFLYGILAECDLRELKYSDGWYKWQHERALAEHYAERQSGGAQ